MEAQQVQGETPLDETLPNLYIELVDIIAQVFLGGGITT